MIVGNGTQASELVFWRFNIVVSDLRNNVRFILGVRCIFYGGLEVFRKQFIDFHIFLAPKFSTVKESTKIENLSLMCGIMFIIVLNRIHGSYYWVQLWEEEACMEQYVRCTYDSSGTVRDFMEACTASYGTVPYASTPPRHRV